MHTQTTESKPTHDEIARRAQAIFEESGRVPGRDNENWLQAEKELIAARRRKDERGAREEKSHESPSRPQSTKSSSRSGGNPSSYQRS